MSSMRKRISIYDYPEHLNPFSECHLNVPDKRKIIVDKLRKNGTWSSKITKRLNRSVSWIEKSWLQIDDSPRRDYESRICNDLHNNALYAKQSQVHNVTRRESCSDVRYETEITFPMQLSKGDLLEKSKSVENLNKCDTRRRKKRPAPLPPNARSSSVIERQTFHNSEEVEVMNEEGKLEKESSERISVSCSTETIAEAVEQDDKSTSDEIQYAEESQTREEPLDKICETKLENQIKNLQIEIKEDEPSKLNLQPTTENESKKTQENISELSLDENANIPTAEDRNENVKIDQEITLKDEVI